MILEKTERALTEACDGAALTAGTMLLGFGSPLTAEIVGRRLRKTDSALPDACAGGARVTTPG